MRKTRADALRWSQRGLLVYYGCGSNNCTAAPAALIRDSTSCYAYDQSIFTQENSPRMFCSPNSHIVQAHGSSSHVFRINELPTDILNEIFLRVVQIAQKDVASEDSMLVPLCLSHVCRTWRHAVISCASLWTYINVLVDVYCSTEQDERLVKAVDTCIEMSKAAPLSLSVTCNTIHAPKPKLDAARYILQRLLGQQHRWRAANFAFKEMDPSRLPEIELIDVPMLESLRISWRTLGAPNIAQPQVRIDASHSPSLRSLHIKGIRFEISGGQLYGIKELTFHGVETEVRLVEHLEIVKKTPYLELLEVEFVSSKLAGPDDFQLDAITLHNLQTLVINGSNVSMSIIRNLLFPDLRRLICGPFGPANYQNIKGLVDMVERNQPPLEYLEICNTSVTDWTEDKVVALLRLLPDLKTLRMERVYVTPDLFNMLSTKDTVESRSESRGVGKILCPKLTEFYLKRNGYLYDGEEKQKECVDSLCNMLEKRCNALGVVGSIEYQSIEPLSVSDSPFFSVPFIDIGCTQMRKALRTTKKLHVRFKKPLIVES